jgi:protein TonB
MFDSVLGTGVGAPGRPGVGAAVSLFLHAFLLALALTYVCPAQGPLPLPHIRFPVPTVRLGAPGAKAPAAARAHPPPTLRPRTTPLAPATVAPRLDDVVPPTDMSPRTQPGDSEGPQGEVPCGQPPCSPHGQPGGDSPVLLLGPEMLPPRLLSGPEPRYPAEAAMEHLGGTVLLRCTVTAEGTVEGCTLLKSAPLLDEAALRAVTARRYTPALYEGRPVSVWMVIPVRFVPP